MIAFGVSWVALLLALVGVLILARNLQDERTKRQSQVTRALVINCYRREYLIQAMRRLFVKYQTTPLPAQPTRNDLEFYRTLDETIHALAPFACTDLPVFNK